MPRNYENNVIYKIVCKDLSVKDCYVGQTTNFKLRKSDHKANSICHHYKVYQFIRNNGGWDNFDMIEIEKFPCKDGNEARARERYWYEELNSSLNTIKPLITEDKKEYKIQQDKTYRQLNKVSIAARKKITQQLNKVSIAAHKKDYYENNKAMFAEKSKLYYEKNIDKVKSINQAVHICECGRSYTHNHKTRHLKSKIHLDNLNNE